MEQETWVHLKSASSGGISSRGIYFRNGDPTDWKQLDRVSPQSASDIIILGRGSEPDDSDQYVIQILLAVAALPHSSHGEVFAEMRIAGNVQIAPVILENAAGIVARQPVNRLLILLGLEAAIGNTLIAASTFMDGDQLYLTEVPPLLVGTSFDAACYCFPKAVLIGAKKGYEKTTNGIAPRPDQSVTLEAGDQIVVLAENRYAAEFTSMQDPPEAKVIDKEHLHCQCNKEVVDSFRSGDPITICLLGCPSDFPDLLSIIDALAPDGSIVYILSERDEAWRKKEFDLSYGSDVSLSHWTNNDLPSLEVKHVVGPPASARHLYELGALEKASCVFILSETVYPDEDPTAADARNLSTLITLKGLYPELRPQSKCRVVCEIQDPRTEYVVNNNKQLSNLGEGFCSVEYCYTNKLETGLFAMASENRSVFNALVVMLQPNSLIDVIGVPWKAFLEGPEELHFWELHLRVRQQSGGILLGWQLLPEGQYSKQYPPDVNPADKERRMTWSTDDPMTKDALLIIMRREADGWDGPPAGAWDSPAPPAPPVVQHFQPPHFQPPKPISHQVADVPGAVAEISTTSPAGK